MLRYAGFALLVGLSATIPAGFALDPPQRQNKQQGQNKQEPRNEKKAEPAKKEAPGGDERLDRRNSRMKERNREIDGMLNKQK
jgi:hypothetical protein